MTGIYLRHESVLAPSGGRSPMTTRKRPAAEAKRGHAAAWLLVLALAASGAVWITEGRAFVRRTVFAVPPIPESARTQSGFLAILFPRVSASRSRFAMSSRDLREFLARLKAEGYVSIALSDVRGLYGSRRLLPQKAVLLAFSDASARGIAEADDALRAEGMRGTAFIRKVSEKTDPNPREYLSSHAVEQMRKSGAWEFGLISSERPSPSPLLGEVRAVLDDGGRPAPKDKELFPFRFAAAETGWNAADADVRALNVLALRPERGLEENLRVAAAARPRSEEFSDDFSGDRLGPDWIAAYGITAAGRGRLTLLPTPRQTGAGVFLRGAEQWRDVVVEADLKRYRKEFWAYARYRDDGGFVRAGVRNGYWYVEQKVSSMNLPTMLARAPVVEGSLPARMRFVVKGDGALLHVNGRLMFGRALRIHPKLQSGRVMLGVYDARTRSALAVLTRVKAAPLAERWISFKKGRVQGAFDDRVLEGLRERAALARAVSPRWLAISPDGGVSIDLEQQSLVRSLAGFYSCRLIPMAEISGGGSALDDVAAADRALASLEQAARVLDAPGVNLRLRGADAERPGMLRFVARLRDAVHGSRRELWVTLDEGREADPALAAAADGVLRAASAPNADLELLEAAPARSAVRPQQETASNL